MSFKPTDRAAVPPNVMARVVGEEVVILDLVSGTYFGLDPVGARAWQLWGEHRTLAETCEIMGQEFEVDAHQLAQDLSKLAADLLAQGLLQVALTGQDPPA